MRAIGDLFHRRVSLRTDELSISINMFLDQMGSVLNETPQKVGKFRLTEISISAEITTEGKVVLCGVGGEVGISGGLEFTFKRELG
jgi:hypothetical protein